MRRTTGGWPGRCWKDMESGLKVLLVVMDGLADVSQPGLGWRTPLQAAETPFMDRLAREGCSALMYPLSPGICPSSEVAHWSIFGYRPQEFPGRAYLHALDAGLPCREGDALFMFNLVPVVEKDGMVFVKDSPGLDMAEICSQKEALLRGCALQGMELFYMGGIEFIAVLRGGSAMVSPTDPFLHHYPVGDIRAVEGWEKDAETAQSVETLRAFVSSAEKALAAESGCGGMRLGLIMKWPSKATKVESFEERYGMRAAAVVSTPCFRGFGKLLSMRVEDVARERAGEDMEQKLSAASELLERGYEFVFLHTKHPDEAAHTGEPGDKMRVIEELDRAFSGASDLLDRRDLLTVITCDHSTPTARDPRLIHGGDPVPVLFHGATVRRDGVDAFDEVRAAGGGMGQLRGGDLMPLVLYLSRRARFFTGS